MESITLARHYPKLKLIIQDNNPDFIKQGRNDYLKKEAAEVQKRIEFVEYDYDRPQTVQADVFLLNRVLKHKTDDDCIRMIKAIVPAMTMHTKILVNDSLYPEPATERSGLFGDKQIQ